MKKIMILHPEGNINFNPNLTGIVEILCEQQYVVHYYCPRKSGFSQIPPCSGATIVYLENNQVRLADSYDLIIGVDYGGIILASMVARQLRIPYGFISYELFFSDETGMKFKTPEIESCQGIAFAVCQGGERSRQLAIENRFPPEKVINIPVAGRSPQRGLKTRWLHESLGLPANRKVALYIGSLVSAWAMLDELIENTHYWGDEWVLVLHTRYDEPRLVQDVHKKHPEARNVFFSPECGISFEKLQNLIYAADMGLAFYKPTFTDFYDGKNLQYIGLSSGKIATYLQHGLPVVTNASGEISDYVEQYKLGFAVRDIRQLHLELRKVNSTDLAESRESCFRFFHEKLDLNTQAGPLLEVIKQAVS